MRIPISRVRSVTDTSMMFMIPMPPTSSDTLATLASSAVIVRLERSSDVAISASVTVVEVHDAAGDRAGEQRVHALAGDRVARLRPHGEVVRVGRAETHGARAAAS